MTDPLTEPEAMAEPWEIVTETRETAPSLRPWHGLWSDQAQVVVRPATTRETSEVVRSLRDRTIPLTLPGGNVGLVDGDIPEANGGIVLQTDRMTDPIKIAPADGSASVNAGVKPERMQDAADHGVGSVRREIHVDCLSEVMCTRFGVQKAFLGPHGMFNSHLLTGTIRQPCM